MAALAWGQLVTATDKSTEVRWGDRPIPLLHLIAQYAWHDPAFVVGNRLGLQALRDAIDKALTGAPGEVEVFCDDGEGYSLHVRCIESDGMGEIPFGYTADYASGNRGWPEWMSLAT